PPAKARRQDVQIATSATLRSATRSSIQELLMHLSSPISHKKARIEIIPLIDIMFFLLASFMMVSMSQVHMKGIKVTLPTGASGETQSKRDYISISCDVNGTPYFDKKPVSYEELTAILRKVHQE